RSRPRKCWASRSAWDPSRSARTPTSSSFRAIRSRRSRGSGRSISTGGRSLRVNEMSAILVLSMLLAQNAPKEEKKPAYTALVGGDVQTVTEGVLKGGTVLIKDDKIFKIGPAVELPEGTVKIDVTGKRVLPGFVAASARSLGVSPAAGKIADALDPFSESIRL